MDAPIFDPESGAALAAGDDHSSPAFAPPSAPPCMSLDAARALLVRQHGVAVANDDPLLMVVSLHQGFVADYEKMLQRHDSGIRNMLGATGEACAEAVEAVLASLKDKTVKASLDQAFALVAHQAKDMEQLRRELRRHRRFHLALSLLTLIASGLVVSVLVSIIR